MAAHYFDGGAAVFIDGEIGVQKGIGDDVANLIGMLWAYALCGFDGHRMKRKNLSPHKEKDICNYLSPHGVGIGTFLE